MGSALLWRMAAAACLGVALLPFSMNAADAARPSASSGSTLQACQPWTGAGPPNPGGSAFSSLTAVDVASPCSAWAVGYFSTASNLATLIVRWNGRSWTQVKSPNPDSATMGNRLLGVAARSPHDAWAVGGSSIMAFSRTLIAHWDGTTWRRVASPNGPGVTDILQGVAATSRSNAWAVGLDLKAGAFERALILHWNGRRWAIGSDSRSGNLQAVAARSARDAWAVGFDQTNGGGATTVILHWNGRSWSKVRSPSPGRSSILFGVAAVSATDAWAVGESQLGSGFVTLIVHWNGKQWQRIADPNGFGSTAGTSLSAVTADSARDAWAVGVAGLGTSARTLVVHWNGSSWQRIPSPNPEPAGEDALAGVDAASAGNVWMVGTATTQDGHTSRTIALHCC